MADRFRIVTFSPGGRPIVQMDLNNGTTHTFVRDGLTLSAPNRQQQWSQAIQRYQGSLLARESHENGTLMSEWYVSGAGVGDAAEDNMELLMAQFESVAEGRYIEWRQENTSRSTYYPIRGPAPWEFLYRWIEFQAVKTLHVKGGWTIAPLAEGDRMEIDDPFDLDSSGDFTALTGTLQGVIPGSGLIVANTIRHAYHSARGYRYGDAQVTAKYANAAVTAGDTLSATLALDANNFIEARFTGSALSIQKTDAGVTTQLATVAVTAMAQNSRYSVVLRKEGNQFFAELWDGSNTDPRPMFAVPNSTSVALTGADATKFGVGVTMLPGHRNIAAVASAFMTNFRVEPYVYRNHTLPEQIKLDGVVPGDAPAATTATITHLGGASNPIWGMIAWAPRSNPGFNMVQVGDFEFGINGLWSTATVANINAASTSFTRVTSSSAKYGTQAAQVVAPGSAAQEGINFPIYRTFKKGVSYTVRAWVRTTTGGGTNMRLNFGDGPNGDFVNGSIVTPDPGPMQLLTATWTPTADRTVAYVGVVIVTATVMTFQVDGVVAYETALGLPVGYANTEGRAGYQPFGVFEGENAGLMSQWPTTPTASATYLNGRGLEINMASVAFAETIHWLDPSLIVADDMYRGDIEVEVWVRALIPNTASSLILTALAAPLSGVSVAGGGRYTREFGSSGKLLVSQIPVGSPATRLIRAGTITMNTNNSVQWGLHTRFDWNSAASTGTLGLDYIMLVPVRGRASSPTAKQLTGGYAAFIQSASVETSKVIYPNLRGAAAAPPGPAFPDTGLGGAPLWLRPGSNDVLVKLSSTIPDDPFAQTAGEQLSHTATVKFSPVPRYFITRGT